MAKWHNYNRWRRQLRHNAETLEDMRDNHSDYEYDDFIEVLINVHKATRRLPVGDYAQMYVNRINEVMSYMDLVWYKEQIDDDYWR